MVLDSSALVPVILDEAGSAALLAKIIAAPAVALGAPSLAETLIVVRRLGGDAAAQLYELLREIDVKVIAFTEEHSRVALEAYLRFGKWRHPAALNFGECLSYAAATIAGQPLMYLGNDFAQTDLASA